MTRRATRIGHQPHIDVIGPPTAVILCNGKAMAFRPVVSSPVVPVWAAEGRG